MGRSPAVRGEIIEVGCVRDASTSRQGGKLLVFFRTMSLKSLRPRGPRASLVGLMGFAIVVGLAAGLLWEIAKKAFLIFVSTVLTGCRSRFSIS